MKNNTVQSRPVPPPVAQGRSGKPTGEPHLNWTTAKWTLPGAWLPIIPATGIVVVPSGMDGIRVSQASGTRPGMF